MATFLNLNLEGNTPLKFYRKHILFSLLWIFILGVFIFRIDSLIIGGFNNLKPLISILPIFYIIFLVLFTISQKWYSIAFLFYPILAVFWFIPKTILSKGKIYLFGHYVNNIYKKFTRLKLTLIHSVVLIVPFILILLSDSQWIRCIAVVSFSYFYIRSVYNYVYSSFKPAELFGVNLHDSLEDFIEKGKNNQSVIIKSYVNQKDDEKLPCW